MDSALLRIPALAQTGIRKFYNGPESFTPDNQFILGEAPEVRNFFVAAGLNSVGIATAGGAGRALAEWIDGGGPSMDLTASTSGGSPPSTATTSGCTTGSRRCSACTTRSPGRTARCGPPGRSAARPSTTCCARPTRTSAAGWAGNGPTSSRLPGQSAEIEYSWGKQNWLPCVRGGAARRPARRSPYSTRPRSPSSC